MIKFLSLVFLLLTLLCPAPSAQDWKSIKSAIGFMPDPEPGMGGSASVNKIDEDWFLNVNLGFTIDLGKVGIGLQAPLRLRIIDELPHDNGDHIDTLREEDWDEPADFLRLIRFVRLGRKGDTFHARVGDLRGVSLGHGTIMQNYYNNLDINHFQIGGVLDIDTDFGGFESVCSNGAEASVYGGRVYLRPAKFFSDSLFLGPLAIGASFVIDRNAPYQLADSSGNAVTNVSTQNPALDNDGYPVVFGEKEAMVYGIDIEYRLPDLGILQTTPYADFNCIDGAGNGFHTGVLFRASIPIISIDLEARGEFRRLDHDYLAAYFGSHYEIQRYNYSFTDTQGTFGLPAGSEVTSIPKRMALEHLDQGIRNGYYGDLSLKIMDMITVHGAYDDYEGDNNSNVRAFLSIPVLDSFQFNCAYAKFNFEGVEKAFEFDDRSMFLLEGVVPINTFMSLAGRYSRCWQLDSVLGTYEPVDDWSVGVVMKFEF